MNLWGYASLFLLRPLLAVLFVSSLILLSWYVAWKTVLVHVPLVQEVCGLRRKPVKPKPSSRHRLSRFYHGASATAASSRNPLVSSSEREETHDISKILS